MPTFIVALLIVAALALLASAMLSGRRDRDPASSVDHFNRAMTAMSNSAPRPSSPPGSSSPREASSDDADDLAQRR